MRLHAVLFSAAILAASAAAAQSTPSPALPDSPRDSRLQLPAFAPRSTQPAPHPQLLVKTNPGVVVLKPSGPINIARNQVCYAIRTYNFPTGPTSDITKPTNITTCEPAKNAALKSTATPTPRLVY